MSLKDFNGETFVAFVDISGFKKQVQAKDNMGKAMTTLRNFYNIGYDLLSKTDINNNKVYGDISGIFVSDCAILYVNNQELSVQDKCKKILDIVKEINKECIEKEIMLTTNIAYGDFEYRKKIELNNMQKGNFTGNAYIDAYIDSTKKMKVCYCRIIKDGIEDDIIGLINDKYIITKRKKYFYFFWQCKTKEQIRNYIREYMEIKRKYKDKDKVNEKFKKICNLTKRYSDATE